VWAGLVTDAADQREGRVDGHLRVCVRVYVCVCVCVCVFVTYVI